MSDCASRMANHHVATVPESLERAPIEVRAPIGERSVTPEHAAYRALAVSDATPTSLRRECKEREG